MYILYIYVYSVSAQNGLAFCGQRQSFKGPGFAWAQRKKRAAQHCGEPGSTIPYVYVCACIIVYTYIMIYLYIYYVYIHYINIL